MDYKPRHAQPFTLAEAARLDPPTITEGSNSHLGIFVRHGMNDAIIFVVEIARLQNSLQHLERTQDELRQCIQEAAVPDADFLDAIKENQDVIGSQEERITILKMALIEKGIILPGSHHDARSQQRSSRPAADPLRSEPVSHAALQDDEGGIIL
ncbi:hypothetical protein EW146_g5688 [Bondarzewia mesenterica]|uniref:Uncharacterized protein n=1 Tax=Bondarzewia mesenterica TaxID=1095465 RepID=A0A4S4LQQ9_9AGAM|nr:hypothetical protein EW146_g5688 [Bondarzewia mesenterica]